MKATVKEKTEVAKGTLLVKLQVNPEEFKFIPGQYMALQLINPPFTDDEGNNRFFSIIYFPGQPNTVGITTRLRDSAFKKSLKAIPEGTEVNIKSITGDFILPHNQDFAGSKSLVFIAGGIGITPFLSMIRFNQEQNFKYNITLIYSNRDKVSTAYYDELSQIQNPEFKVIFTMTEDQNWHSEKRRVDANFIKEYIQDLSNKVFYAAGPPAMVAAIESELGKLNIPKQNIKVEDFTGY